MTLEILLDDYPKEFALKDDLKCVVRPLESEDEQALREFILAVPEKERMFLKNRVTDPAVVHAWCQNIDYGRNLSLLAFTADHLIGVAALHQHLGGWKRHIARVNVWVHLEFRGRGLARALVQELIDFSRNLGLAKLEAEFIGEQEAAMHMFAFYGFTQLVRLRKYVRDMDAASHDYVMMGLDLTTPEEYAGMG